MISCPCRNHGLFLCLGIRHRSVVGMAVVVMVVAHLVAAFAVVAFALAGNSYCMSDANHHFGQHSKCEQHFQTLAVVLVAVAGFAVAFVAVAVVVVAVFCVELGQFTAGTVGSQTVRMHYLPPFIQHLSEMGRS